MKQYEFSKFLTAFFTEYLAGERGMSSNTMRSYSTTFSQWLDYMLTEKKIKAERIKLDHINRKNVTAFLDWLQNANSVGNTTRNQRLAAIHALCRYMQYEDVIHLEQWQDILAIKIKKIAKPTVNYLSLEGMKLLLDADFGPYPAALSIKSVSLLLCFELQIKTQKKTMAGKVTQMSKIKQLLQLHESGLSNRRIAESLSLDRETVNNYVRKFKTGGMQASELLKVEDPVLEGKFIVGTAAYTDKRFEEFKEMLRKPSVIRLLSIILSRLTFAAKKQ